MIELYLHIKKYLNYFRRKLKYAELAKSVHCVLHLEFQCQKLLSLSSGIYPSTFVDSHFPPIIQFLYCLLISVAPWGGPVVDTKGKMFEMYVCRLPENAFFSDFSGNLRVYTYIQVSFMHVCDDPNQRVRKIAQ